MVEPVLLQWTGQKSLKGPQCFILFWKIVMNCLSQHINKSILTKKKIAIVSSIILIIFLRLSGFAHQSVWLQFSNG